MSECTHESESFESLKSLESGDIGVMSHWSPLSHLIPWDMPSNFCFQVYAQKPQFMGEKIFQFSMTNAIR